MTFKIKRIKAEEMRLDDKYVGGGRKDERTEKKWIIEREN